MSIVSKQRQEEIDTEIERLLFHVQMKTPESSVVDIAKEIGLEVKMADLPYGVRGVIRDKTIIINKNRPKMQRNFMIAHLLGHYILHRNHIKDKASNKE